MNVTCRQPLNSELIKHLKSQKLAHLIRNHESILEADLKKYQTLNQELALAIQLTMSLGIILGSEMNETQGAISFTLGNCRDLRLNPDLNTYELDVSFLSKYNNVIFFILRFT